MPRPGFNIDRRLNAGYTWLKGRRISDKPAVVMNQHDIDKGNGYAPKDKETMPDREGVTMSDESGARNPE